MMMTPASGPPGSAQSTSAQSGPKPSGAAPAPAADSTPVVAFRAARDAVKVERAEGLVTAVRDVGRVQGAAGTRAALEGLKIAEGPEDVATLALTAAAFDLFGWLFAAVWAVFGFAVSVKRITERTTARYLRWRKARRWLRPRARALEPGTIGTLEPCAEKRPAGRSEPRRLRYQAWLMRSVRRIGTSRSAWSIPAAGSGRGRATGASTRHRNSRRHRIPRCRIVLGPMRFR